MKIIKPSFNILPRDEQRGGLKAIEAAGRVCYKSEDKISDDSTDTFVKGMIKRKHFAMLEHGDMIFEISDVHIFDNVAGELQMFREKGMRTPMLEMTNIDCRYIISGNIRAWMELFGSAWLAGRYFIGHFDPIYTQGQGFYDEDADPDFRVRQIRYADLNSVEEKKAHIRQTVKFTVDRGVSHEFVRHRAMSFAQESTRYCNYSLDKFGSEITVIEPCYLVKHSEPYELWKRSCMTAEVEYFTMLNLGLQPQEARAVLPHSIKTELVMTGTLGMWNNFFDLRARQITGKAHPQAAEVAVPLMEEMAIRFSDVFGGTVK
ncbi:MAG: FAD-dependent thymidylate synthase [Clostridia bacterium]|nr:FAD-dependent thymidylate synthase [Clostridia bacterium]